MAHDLGVFVVPDVRLARAAGLDLEAAGLRPAATPRHATVLLLVGPIPDAMSSAAGVVYAQMPRPRAIVATGVSALTGLPEPDVVTPLDQNALRVGVAALRQKLAMAGFALEVATLEIAAAQTRTEYVCPMHPRVVRDEPGSCPICDMDLAARESAVETTEHAHDHTGTATHDGTKAPDHVENGGPPYTCPMHPQIAQPEPGHCLICGMNLVPAAEVHDGPNHDPEPTADHEEHAPATAAHEDHTGHRARHAEHDAAADVEVGVSERDMNHGAVPHDAMTHAATDQRPPGHGTPHHGEPAGHAETAMDDSDVGALTSHMNHAAMDHRAGADAAMDHGEMDHSEMDHSMAGDFMSMVAMTEHLPRSDDGLPMEWIDVPFGPLFPGLPGGLDVTFTLDGDGVARAAMATGATARGLEETWAGPIETFPERLARVDPLTPVAYRLLARRALEAVAALEIGESLARSRIREAEWERVGSHLGWLAEFGSLIGDRWVAQRAAALQVAVAGTRDEAGENSQEIRDFVRLVARAPLIDRRLAGIGKTGTVEPDRMRGPVVRAAGIATDARTDVAGYQALGFTPVMRTGGDALARLQVRVAEIAASLELFAAAADGGHGAVHDVPLPSDLSGMAEAAIETPRGAAQLHVVVEQGAVVAAHLDPPSTPHIGIVPDITAGEEVADALVAVASLDLSPWEVDR